MKLKRENVEKKGTLYLRGWYIMLGLLKQIKYKYEGFFYILFLPNKPFEDNYNNNNIKAFIRIHNKHTHKGQHEWKRPLQQWSMSFICWSQGKQPVKCHVFTSPPCGKKLRPLVSHILHHILFRNALCWSTRFDQLLLYQQTGQIFSVFTDKTTPTQRIGIWPWEWNTFIKFQLC